jgi:glycine oxidase
MLAGGAEATDEDPFQELCHASRALWPGWAAELQEASGVDCELKLSGLLRVTMSDQGASQLERKSQGQRQRGVQVSSILDPDQLALLVPGLGPRVVAGLHYPSDGHVHTHRVTEALLLACARQGVAIETNAEVLAIGSREGRPSLSLRGGRDLVGDYVVVCAGSWTAELLPPPLSGQPAVEPVRGQIVALDPGHQLLPMIVFGDDGYLLQKRSGLVLAGATEERVGFQPWPTVQGVARLIGSAADLMPQLDESRFAYAWAGLRPHAPDGWPLLGRIQEGGRLLLATAHYRNGVLLAPLTAQLIARAIFEGADPPELAAFSPGRLA